MLSSSGAGGLEIVHCCLIGAGSSFARSFSGAGWRVLSLSLGSGHRICQDLGPERRTLAVSTLFVTAARTETLNGTILGVFSCYGGETRVTPKTVPFSKNQPHYIMSLHEQSENPASLWV